MMTQQPTDISFIIGSISTNQNSTHLCTFFASCLLEFFWINWWFRDEKIFFIGNVEFIVWMKSITGNVNGETITLYALLSHSLSSRFFSLFPVFLRQFVRSLIYTSFCLRASFFSSSLARSYRFFSISFFSRCPAFLYDEERTSIYTNRNDDSEK